MSSPTLEFAASQVSHAPGRTTRSGRDSSNATTGVPAATQFTGAVVQPELVGSEVAVVQPELVGSEVAVVTPELVGSEVSLTGLVLVVAVPVALVAATLSVDSRPQLASHEGPTGHPRL